MLAMYLKYQKAGLTPNTNQPTYYPCHFNCYFPCQNVDRMQIAY